MLELSSCFQSITVIDVVSWSICMAVLALLHQAENTGGFVCLSICLFVCAYDSRLRYAVNGFSAHWLD